MARIRISIDTRDGDFEVSLDALERPGREIDTATLDALVDKAVVRIRRAYGSAGV